MSELADLFPGFASDWITTDHGRIFARRGGSGPPLLLLHGYPQTHVMWHRIAPQLAAQFTVIVADLPGYGWSDVPASDAAHTPFTKRAMGAAMIDLMERLGHARFALVGHDRGARVTYRLALDHPGRLTRLAVLDILPTLDYWGLLDRSFALKIYHWLFLAQPEPLPENLIGRDPDGYFGATWRAWSKTGKNAFDPRAVKHYLAAFQDPLRIHAVCEDYRAGADADVSHDEADVAAGRKITEPLLVLWGSAGLAGAKTDPLAVWRQWATNVQGGPVDCGHFLPEENPSATLAALLPFLMSQ